ncbi:MAG TPA: hypothetical protein VMW50_04410 [Dehalococcoidia bacterium]|nr:hypothetical protein [Dehalococcoidia bacterium]
MADTTPIYAFSIPTVGGDTDLWGGFLNANWNLLEDILSGTGQLNGVDMINAVIHAVTADIDTATILAGSIQADASSSFSAPLILTGAPSEGVQALTTASPAVNPASGGPICSWVPSNGNNTPAITLTEGQYVTLHILAGTGTYVWAGVTWLNGAPAIVPSTVNVVEFFMINGTIFGAYVGAV